jgi:hypothetical protein
MIIMLHCRIINSALSVNPEHFKEHHTPRKR